MVLSVAGNIDENEIIAICDECLKPCDDMKLEVSFPEEPTEIVRRTSEEHFDVGVPIFSIGFKCSPYPSDIVVKKEVEADLLLSLLTDKMSPLYKQLTDEGLITSELGKEVFDGKGYFTLILSGESKNPEAVLERVLEFIEKAKNEGLDRETFNLLKKAEYGSVIRAMNHPDGYADNMMSFYFYGLDAFEFERRLAEVTFEDVTNAIDEFFGKDNYSISIIR
jgi:predicted Zn-dependent peptidase